MDILLRKALCDKYIKLSEHAYKVKRKNYVYALSY
jgi:hypothetical protein